MIVLRFFDLPSNKALNPLIQEFPIAQEKRAVEFLRPFRSRAGDWVITTRLICWIVRRRRRKKWPWPDWLHRRFRPEAVFSQRRLLGTTICQLGSACAAQSAGLPLSPLCPSWLAPSPN